MRINQYIASAGITSRRKADEMIEEGRVRINGAVLLNPGYHVQDGDVVEWRYTCDLGNDVGGKNLF